MTYCVSLCVLLQLHSVQGYGSENQLESIACHLLFIVQLNICFLAVNFHQWRRPFDLKCSLSMTAHLERPKQIPMCLHKCQIKESESVHSGVHFHKEPNK